MASSKTNMIAFLWLVLSQCMIAVNIVYTKKLLPVMQPYSILFFRFLIGFIVLIMIQLLIKPKAIAIIKKQTKPDWLAIFLQAITAGALFNVFMIIGLHHTTASMAGMIGSALPAIVVLLSIIVLRVKITWSMIVCVTLAVLGLIVMHVSGDKAGPFQWFGNVMILLSLVADGLYYILTKRLPVKMPIFLLSAILNMINIPLMLLLALGHHDFITFNMPLHQWCYLFMVGLSVAGFYVFWFLGCGRVHGIAVGLSTAVMPVATIWLAFVLLGEQVHIWQILGMCIVLCSIVVNAAFQKKSSKVQSHS